MKYGYRAGDAAPMALVQLVDQTAVQSEEQPAETKAAEVMSEARAAGMPLQLTTEPE